MEHGAYDLTLPNELYSLPNGVHYLFLPGTIPTANLNLKK